MDVSLLQEKSTFPVLTMRMSPHLEPFFLIYDCILHKCCAISNQYHFTNPISTFLPKFQGGGPDPRSPPLDPPMWRSRLATTPDIPTCILIHGVQFTCRVHPQNQFVPEIVSPLPCSPALVRHTLLIVYFFKELISFIGSLDKCHFQCFDLPLYQTGGFFY